MRKTYEKPTSSPIELICGQLLQGSPGEVTPAEHSGPDAFDTYSDQDMLTRKSHGWSAGQWDMHE